MRRGANLPRIGTYNESVVINALRRGGGLSQTELAAMTGLAPQTVSGIVRQLVGKGMVRRAGRQVIGRGRPRVMLELDPASRFAVGVHIDPARAAAVVLDLRGDVIASRAHEGIVTEDPGASVRRVASMAERMIAETHLDPARIVGVGLAVPGPVDVEAGRLLNPPWLLGWEGYPIQAQMSRSLGSGVLLEKDTMAAVTGETWLRTATEDTGCLVFVYLGMGIGVGFSVDGEVFRGASANAGEVGRIFTRPGTSALGRDGHFTGVSTDPAVLVRRAEHQGVLPAGRRRTLRQVDRAFRRLCALAEGGDAEARAILEGSARDVGWAVCVLAELLDADAVVFGGPYWELLERYYRPAAADALAGPHQRGPHPVTVSGTLMGDRVGAIGAAAMVLDHRYVPRAAMLQATGRGPRSCGGASSVG